MTCGSGPTSSSTASRGWRRSRTTASAAAGKLAKLSAEVMAARRQHPTHDLLSLLVEVEIDGRPLTDEEIIGFCLLLISGGHETTAKLIANGVRLFASHPDQRDELIEQPGLMPQAVEELLRFTSPTQYMTRTTTRDVILHDTCIPAGAPVALLLGSGNRDPREFERPDEFDVRRTNPRILAFGHGAHVCLGAAVARLEARVALEEFLARYPRVRRGRERRGVHALRQRAGPGAGPGLGRVAGRAAMAAAAHVDRRANAAGRGSAPAHGPRPLRRRPPRTGHAARRVRTQPRGARRDPRDRRGNGTCRARRRARAHRRRPRRRHRRPRASRTAGSRAVAVHRARVGKGARGGGAARHRRGRDPSAGRGRLRAGRRRHRAACDREHRRGGARPRAPPLFDAVGTNVLCRRAATYGDVEGAFERADHVVRRGSSSSAWRTYRSKGVRASPGSTRRAASWTIDVAHQNPHALRAALAAILRTPGRAGHRAVRRHRWVVRPEGVHESRGGVRVRGGASARTGGEVGRGPVREPARRRSRA